MVENDVSEEKHVSTSPVSLWAREASPMARRNMDGAEGNIRLLGRETEVKRWGKTWQRERHGLPQSSHAILGVRSSGPMHRGVHHGLMNAECSCGGIAT